MWKTPSVFHISTRFSFPDSYRDASFFLFINPPFFVDNPFFAQKPLG